MRPVLLISPPFFITHRQIPIPVAEPNSCFSWDFSTTGTSLTHPRAALKQPFRSQCTRARAGGNIDFAVTLFPADDEDGQEAVVLEEKQRCSSHLSSIKGMIALGTCNPHPTHIYA